MKYLKEEYNGFKFKMGENMSFRSIVESEVYKRFYGLPKKLNVLIDVGAHIGGTSILGASLGAEVFAYEPDKTNFDLLVENVKLNGFENKIHCFHKAIGLSGKRKIWINDDNTGGSGFFLKYLQPERTKTEIVDTISLEQVFEDNQIKYCDVLKVDCEGCEYELIPNSEKLFKKIGQISMEIHTSVQPKGYTACGNAKRIVALLKRFYKVDVLQSSQMGADSCVMIICIKL